ncbi:hypothetical protein AB833_08005 [Chromatiales bacterium (ex Bugula neritina AB1)]|nr:hypothetical protein AB833_08005 [Chromatiales bacterium (ex Bugula neritina AB1)]
MDIGQLIQEYGVPAALWSGFLLCLGWWIRHEWKILGTPADGAFETRLNRLRGADGEGRDYAQGYKARLKSFLARVDQYFGALPAPDEQGEVKALEQIRLSLSVNAFERLLLLAVAYPVLFVVLAWLFTNSGELGDLALLGETERAWQRAVAALFLGLGIFSFYRFAIVSGWRQWVWLIVASVLASAFAGVVVFSGAFDGITVFVSNLGGAIASVLAGGAIGSYILVAVAVEAGAAASVLTCLVMGAVGLSGVFNSSGTYGLALAFVFALFTLLCVIGVESSSKRAREGKYLHLHYLAFYLLYLLFCAVAVWMIVAFADPGRYRPAFTLLLFLGILPVFNAPLDWLSFGITRGLLRSIVGGGHGAGWSLFWALADVVLALLLLVLVAATTWGGVYLMNQVALWAGGAVVVDLDNLLRQLRAGNWRENLWIWLMLGSTLIPTAIHFLIASMAGFLALNRATVKTVIAKMQMALDKKNMQGGDAEREAAVVVDSDAQRQAFFYLYIAPVLVGAVWLLLVLGVALVFMFWLPDLVQWFLSLFGGPDLPPERELFRFPVIHQV